MSKVTDWNSKFAKYFLSPLFKVKNARHKFNALLDNLMLKAVIFYPNYWEKLFIILGLTLLMDFDFKGQKLPTVKRIICL